MDKDEFAITGENYVVRGTESCTAVKNDGTQRLQVVEKVDGGEVRTSPRPIAI